MSDYLKVLNDVKIYLKYENREIIFPFFIFIFVEKKISHYGDEVKTTKKKRERKGDPSDKGFDIDPWWYFH
jgi:hypothetical protein